MEVSPLPGSPPSIPVPPRSWTRDCHCARMPSSTHARAEAIRLPCPCFAQEMLVVPREGIAQQRATTMPGMSPKLGQTPSPPSVSWYVLGEPPHGPSPTGRWQQGQDRGQTVHPALQVRAKIPETTPAAPPHCGPRDLHRENHQHPNAPQDPYHGQERTVPISPQLARPADPAQKDRTEKATHKESPKGYDGASGTKIALVSTQIRAGPGSRGYKQSAPGLPSDN